MRHIRNLLSETLIGLFARTHPKVTRSFGDVPISIINSYIVLITRKAWQSRGPWVVTKSVRKYVYRFHLHKHSYQSMKTEKSRLSQTYIKSYHSAGRFSSRSAVQSFFLLNCVLVRTFIATTKRITIIIKPFIMKQEKPLHARRQSEKSCERKKVNDNEWYLFSTWAIKVVVDIHV